LDQLVQYNEVLKQVQAVGPTHTKHFATLMEIHSGRHFNTLGAPSQECQTALANVQTVADGTACALRESVFEPANTTTPTQFAADVQAFCEGTCEADLLPALRATVSACNFDETTVLPNGVRVVDLFRLIIASVKVPCIQANDEYCFAKFYQEQASPTLAEGNRPTDQDMANLCTPCIPKILRVMAIFEPQKAKLSAMILSVACMRDQGKWCYREIQAIQDLNQNDPIATKVQTTCRTNCYPRVVMQMRAYGADGNNFDVRNVVGFAVACGRNEAGELCMPKILTAAAAAETGTNTCPQDPLAANTCDTACGDKIQGFLDATGCCANNYLLMQTRSLEETIRLRTWLSTTCSVEMPDACPALKKIVKRIVLANVKVEVIKARRAAIRAAIRRDVAAYLGVEYEQLAIDGETTVDDGSANRRLLAEDTFEVDIDCPPDSASCDQLEEDLQKINDFLLTPNLSEAVGEDGQEDATKGVGVSVEDGGGAMSGTGAIAPTLAVAVAALFV
jgi:hypothetical protein